MYFVVQNGGCHMHVVLVSPCNQNIMPYLRHYEDIFQRHSIPYDLISWDRLSLSEPEPPHYHCLHHHSPGGSGWFRNLTGYLRFRAFAIRKLNRLISEYPDLVVICLNTQSAVLLARQLARQSYILDIRDYTHESFPPYLLLARRMIQRSRLTVISSEGFRAWLPVGPDYVMSPNIGASDLRHPASPWPSRPWRISSIGVVRNAPENIEFLDAVFGCLTDSDVLGNLEVYYIGEGLPVSETALREHCRQHGYDRVQFQGRYRPEEAARFYEECHFVLGIYGNATPFEQTLTPNRLYQAAIHRRPIIVSEGTHLAEIVRKHGLGIVFTGDGTALKCDLDAYATETVRAAYEMNCRRFLKEIAREIERFESRLTIAIGTTKKTRTTRKGSCSRVLRREHLSCITSISW